MKLLISGKNYIDQLSLKRASYEHLINRINKSRMTIHGTVGRWSVKEIIAHILLCELYLTDRIYFIFSDQNLAQRLSDVLMLGLLFEHDHPEFGSPFGSDTASMNWKIKKYNTIPLEDVVGLENMAYLSFISLLQINEDVLMNRNRFYKEILVSVSNVYDYYSTSIEKWLALSQ